MGVIKEGYKIVYASEVWPPARMQGTQPQNTWTTITSNNGNPQAVPAATTTPAYNLGHITLSASALPNSDMAIYLDDVTIDEYNADNTYARTVYRQSYRSIASFVSNPNIALEPDQSRCYDDDGGCLKFGPSSTSTELLAAPADLRHFRIDPSKKYKVTAHAYGENMPAGANISVRLAYSHGTDEQVLPEPDAPAICSLLY